MNQIPERKTWEEFRETKLLWWINRSLHLFGWAIGIEKLDDGSVIAYPMKVKYRGFDEETENKNFIKLTKYIADTANELVDDTVNSL